MLKLSKFDLSYFKATKVLTILLIFSIFFPIRHVFLSSEAYLTGQYSDFTSFSLYLSDILILTTWFLVIISRGREFCHVVKPLKWLILVLLLSFIVNFGLNAKLSAYLLIKWLELIVAYGTLVVTIKEFELKALILKLFAWLSTFEALLAIIQFFRQAPVGLFKVGEQHIGPSILGIAKIVSGGTAYIRGYGTFPHPNPLSAVVVTGIFMVLYFLTTSTCLRAKITYSALLFINILGLTVTFSRGAYLALVLGLIIFFGYLLWSKRLRTNYLALSTVFISLLISFFLFKPFLLTRATFSDQSTIYRKFYDVTGVKMALKNPSLGLGLGESVLHMEQYSGKVLQPWDKQPPHNYFIIAATELGIPAALILLWFFLSELWVLIKKLKLENNFILSTEYLALSTILCTFLFLMMFDHYFFTLEQTQLLLWFILALIAVETKKSPQGDSPKTYL